MATDFVNGEFGCKIWQSRDTPAAQPKSKTTDNLGESEKARDYSSIYSSLSSTARDRLVKAFPIHDKMLSLFENNVLILEMNVKSWLVNLRVILLLKF